jgi:putative hydrolase of the HAD superfamily
VAALTSPSLPPISFPFGPYGGVRSRSGLAPQPPSGRRGRLYRRRGLILDLDDTLYPRERYVRSGFAAVAKYLERRWGIPGNTAFSLLSRAFTSAHVGREFQAVCQKYELPREEITSMLRAFRAHKPNLWLPYETSQVLRQLRTEGWRLAILTNGLPSVQKAKIEALALEPMVDHVIYAETVTRRGKPDPAVFYEALNRIDLPADRCVVFGDDPMTDIKGARAAGLRTIRLARAQLIVREGCEADLVVRSIEDLPRAAAGVMDMVTLDAA